LVINGSSYYQHGSVASSQGNTTGKEVGLVEYQTTWE
jgi:hypothetical protein